MAGKFYAVRAGKKAGIYSTWDECKKMVDGYSGAQYKSFKTKKDAEEFMGNGSPNVNGATGDIDIYAFVDGSFNSVTNVYGYGGFLCYEDKKIILEGSGSDAEMASMRNVAGEVLGSMAAIRKALELGLDHIYIYYDYMGIEMWATGSWKRNKKGTIAYYDYINSIKDKIDIKFVKVKGHSGVEGNEEADQIAKHSVGIL